jgi:hypothetical protein
MKQTDSKYSNGHDISLESSNFCELRIILRSDDTREKMSGSPIGEIVTDK